MTSTIIPVRIHALLRRVLGVVVPGTGRRRAGERSTAPTPGQGPEEPGTSASGLPAHRSPYGLHEWLDGEESELVRPYVIVCERERALRSRRRVVHVLATDFGLHEHVMNAKEVPV
ncbi:hypothetical protein J7E95_26720 [Streptomyces sp. ISL-14]|nr:hypothetical protein [Streptomyces sp. ISL-14]